MDEPAVQLKFWGTRGSTPTPVAENLKFGGNTACVEVRVGDQILVFDAGSGIRNLGESLLLERRPEELKIDIFLTHFHWDHIQGIPFFRPLFQDHSELHFFTSTTLGPLRERLEGQMTRPYFPISLERLRAPRTFCEAQGSVRRGKVDILLFPLNHPNGATGYRIQTPAGTIVYATDAEHGNPELDRVLRKHAEGADILIYDAQYTPEEYEHFRGWGHSTWLEATRAARDAKVGRLILFHHDPGRTDIQNLKLQDEARQVFENTEMAEEGRVIRLGKAATVAQ
jgi:phosphoribosyl 1,2-cyclic phosphodiesterase